MSRSRPIAACPPYFGAKASCLGDLFAAVARVLPRADWPHATLVDPFLGGGSVSLAAKRLGFRVVCNDLAERSVIVGRALIVNDRVRLTDADVQRLHAGHTANDHRIERDMAPRFFTAPYAHWLDAAFAATWAVEDEARRSLLLLVLMHAILRIRPFADFARTAPTEAFAQGDYDRVRLTIGGLQRLLKLTPSTLVDGLAGRVNAGVFCNGRRHEVHQRDALEVVAATEGDVLYLDPPYVGSNSYEKVYRGLDMILERRDQPRPTSGFNEAGALDLLDRLLESAAHIPAWVISFGGGRITHEEFLARVRRHRPAELAPIKIRYRSGTPGADSGWQREILVVAGKGA